MDRSQAEWIRGTRTRLKRARRACTAIATGVAAMTALSVVHVATLSAQPQRIPQMQSYEPSWWFSGGGAAFQLSEIVDGRSNSTWSFGNDPLWQFQGSIERAMQDNIAIGVNVAHGNVDLRVIPRFTEDPSTPEECPHLCPSTMDLWSVMATFRAGIPRRGFGSTLQGGLGVTGFRNLRTRDTQAPITGFESSWDFTAMLGAGLHYGFSNDFHVTLAQEFGIGFHSKENLPDGASSSFRPRSTRFGLRYGFGARR